MSLWMMWCALAVGSPMSEETTEADWQRKERVGTHTALAGYGVVGAGVLTGAVLLQSNASVGATVLVPGALVVGGIGLVHGGTLGAGLALQRGGHRLSLLPAILGTGLGVGGLGLMLVPEAQLVAVGMLGGSLTLAAIQLGSHASAKRRGTAPIEVALVPAPRGLGLAVRF